MKNTAILFFIISCILTSCSDSKNKDNDSDNLTQNNVDKTSVEDNNPDLKDPKSCLIKYLDAYKTYDFDESKKILMDYSFRDEPRYVMSEYGDINGLFFDSSVPDIKGYKAIFNCKLSTKGGQFLDKRLMVVMYLDKTRKRWAVFGIREPADVNYEYKVAKENVEIKKDFYTAKEYVYANLAYWCMFAGQIEDAKKYGDLAIEEAKKSKNDSFNNNVSSAIESIK